MSQFAIDILPIPASSCDCERLFSELGDLLEPKRRAIGSELLAALQLVRAWSKAGFDSKYTGAKSNGGDEGDEGDGGDEGALSDEDIVRDYNIQEWIINP